MSIEEVLSFLRKHQPMPDDGAITNALIRKYDEIRVFLLDHYDERVVPLLLGSFGSGMGFGIYQLMDEVVRKYPADIVIPALDKELGKDSPGCWWCLQMALDFSDRSLAHHFKRLLFSQSRDERFFAAANLEQIYGSDDRDVVEKAFMAESDAEVKEILYRLLSS